MNFDTVRQSPAKLALQEIYDEYSVTSQIQQKYTGLLGKVAIVLESYEQVTEYFHTIMSKIVDINDRLMNFNKYKEKATQKTQSLEDRMVLLENEVSNLKTSINNVNQELAGWRADVLGGQGMDQKYQILRADVDKINDNISNLVSKVNPETQPNLPSKENPDEDDIPSFRMKPKSQFFRDKKD